MTNSTFRQALLKDQPDQLDPVQSRWIDYALSTNERGLQCLRSIESLTGAPLKGKRLLDIGSGYGGVCIQAALAGADAIGIEPDLRLLSLAEANLQDFGGLAVKFLDRSAVEEGLVQELGQFDVVVCDNVIEHVDFPERLIQVLSTLMRPQGLLYITLPNAFSVGQVLSDCHYALFGITLLDPLDAEQYLHQVTSFKGPYDVTDYHGWDFYLGKFRKYGLEAQLFNAWPTTNEAFSELDSKLRELEDRLRAVSADLRVAPEIRAKISYRLTRYIRIARLDLQMARKDSSRAGDHLFLHALVRDYCVELWYAAVRHRKAE